MPPHPAWVLIALGIVLLAAGLLWLSLPALPGIGRLPGDLHFQGKNFQFSFPLTTCLVASLLLSAVLWLVRYLSR